MLSLLIVLLLLSIALCPAASPPAIVEAVEAAAVTIYPSAKTACAESDVPASSADDTARGDRLGDLDAGDETESAGCSGPRGPAGGSECAGVARGRGRSGRRT